MRVTRLLTAAATALVLAAGTASAQAAGQQQPTWSGDLPAHFAGIALTAAQKERIVALQRQYHARMDALRDSAKAAGAATTGNAALQARIQAVMAEEHAAFRALLDEAGRQRFDANLAKMHRGAHGAGHGAGHGPGHHAGHGRPPRG